MNRREFFSAVTAAVVAVSAGIDLSQAQKKLIARYRRQYSIDRDRWVHRFDVRADGNAFYVDGMTEHQNLTAIDIETMLKPLEQLLGQEVTVAL